MNLENIRAADRTAAAAFLLTTLLLVAACGAFEPPTAEPPAPVEYPINHYRITESGIDFAAWKAEVRALRSSLRADYPFEDRQPSLKGEPREVEFLDKAVDPASIIWRKPSAFWEEPVSLSWWELIDQTGAIRKVFVITSNQTPETDAKIIAWCLQNKTWKPAIIDGKPVSSIRSASINLGESKWHISYFQKSVSEETAAVIAVVLIALVVRIVFALLAKKRAET